MQKKLFILHVSITLITLGGAQLIASPGCLSYHAQFRSKGTPFFGDTHSLEPVACQCPCERYGVEERQLRCKNCGHSKAGSAPARGRVLNPAPVSTALQAHGKR